MKARLIRPYKNMPLSPNVERFLTTGRTGEELEAELKRLNIVRFEGEYLKGGTFPIKDGDWIIDGIQVMSDEEFYKTYDILRDYLDWDPSDQYGQILQAMHLVMEAEEGNATHNFHPMAWGLFKQTTVKQFFRYQELSEWAPKTAKAWEKCKNCDDGKIRLTEEDYKALGEDRLMRPFEVEKDQTPKLASHKFCSKCDYIGYIYVGDKKCNPQ